MVKGAGMKPGGTAGKYIATQAVISGMKAVTSEEEETDENAGVESARLAERETEAALRGLRHAQIRSKRTDVKTHCRGYREATVEKKLKFGSAESMEGWIKRRMYLCITARSKTRRSDLLPGNV